MSPTAADFASYYDPNVVTAASYLGNTACLYDCTLYPYGLLGLTSDTPDGTAYVTMGAIHDTSSGYTYYAKQNFFLITDGLDDVGSYLVRSYVVPLPPPLLLFGSGLLGLLGMARRKSAR